MLFSDFKSDTLRQTKDDNIYLFSKSNFIPF